MSNSTQGFPGESIMTLNEPLSGAKMRPRRPCDSCRRRKSRCEIEEGATACVLCRFHRQECTFLEEPQPRKRKATSVEREDQASSSTSREGEKRSGPNSTDRRIIARRQLNNVVPKVENYQADYANLQGPSLLKQTLGLQNHRHGRHNGKSSVYEPAFLDLDTFSEREEIPVGHGSLYRISDEDSFILSFDDSTANHEEEVYDIETIESIVAPHGPSLVNLFFRIVHPSFPVLHKRVFLEKYARSPQEFSPPLLAAVYILALNWWSYSSDLALLPKPDVPELEKIASKTINDVVSRPKLSTIQAGLLLLQRPRGDSWSLTAQLVGIGHELGLHLNCADWRIPDWEKGLRKRLAWALFMQDKWGALMHGRPSLINPWDWEVKPVAEADFPESAADEDDEDGSTEVEKGRMLFCEMIRLSELLSVLLTTFFTRKAGAEIESHDEDRIRWILDRAKPIQMSLKQWYIELPEALSISNVTMRKLSSVGYLHLAYHTLEICLHRLIIQSLNLSLDDPVLSSICRKAAHTRLHSAVELIKSLRPEHLQSFWYSASEYGFALVGTFAGLLILTAPSRDEADTYKKRLDEYRWLLRLSSKSTDCMDRASKMIAGSTDVLLKGLPLRSNSISVQGLSPGQSTASPPATTAEYMDLMRSPQSYSSEFMWYDASAGGNATHANLAIGPDLGDEHYTQPYLPSEGDFMYQGHYMPSQQ